MIEHDGKGLPASIAPLQYVEVELRNGRLLTGLAKDFFWEPLPLYDGRKMAGDIVKYRVIEPLEKAGLGDSHEALTFHETGGCAPPVVEADRAVAADITQPMVSAMEKFLQGNTDANGQGKQTNPKDLIGARKAKVSVIPSCVIFDVGNAMTEGMCKYGRHNYRHAGVRSSVYYDAAMGHMMDWWEGQDIDPESGLSHVTKAIASLVVLRDAMFQGMLTDDRPPRSVVYKPDFNPKTAEIIDLHADKNPRHFTIADTPERKAA